MCTISVIWRIITKPTRKQLIVEWTFLAHFKSSEMHRYGE